MTFAAAPFETERLRAEAWHAALPDVTELAAAVASILDTESTRHLPPAWFGEYDHDRAADWIREQDAAGDTMLVTERSTGAAVGLLLTSRGDEIRLGYVLAVTAWGRGLASELVAGAVEHARHAGVRTIDAGVDADHAASRLVLESAGFALAGPNAGGALRYRVELSV